MPFQLGLPEIILVLVIALVFLGPKRLPEAGQALGKGMREFRRGMDGMSHHLDADAPPDPALRPVYTPPPAYAPPPGDQPAVYTPPPPPGAPSDAPGSRQTESQ